MRTRQKLILASLLILLLASLAAVLSTRDWSNYRARLRAARLAGEKAQPVDTRPLDTAQQLAPLAVTHSERQDAQEALRWGDRSVDLAFAVALQDASENPPPLTKQTRVLANRIKSLQDANASDLQRVADLKQQLAKAGPARKDSLQGQLDLAQAQLELDADDLDDAHMELIRAGGDPEAIIQQQIDQHEASEIHQEDSHPGSAPPSATPSAPTSTSAAANSALELTKSRSIFAALRAWYSLYSKQLLLVAARNDALADAATLSASQQALQNRLDQEKSRKQILPPLGTQNPPPPSSSAPVLPAARSASAGPSESSPQSALTFLKQLQHDQQRISQVDKRISAEQQLAAAYSRWLEVVDAREKFFLHAVFLAVFWIALIALLVYLAHDWIRGIFARLARDHRDLHTLGAVLLLSLQAAGLILILLVIFGMPGNFGTVVALAGAGLTVALKDFIMGFIGWFVLMGKDGIRPGDWVEINGVSGEVLEVGPLHTVLLETGKWSDAAHPTGRKVSLINSFAIEGQYFNFSTSGQWLWDEIELQVSDDADPYRLAESIKKIAAAETSSDVSLAEKEWERVVPAFAKRNFTAEPSLSLRPSGSGVSVTVRYITRANERQEVRSRIYRAIVDLLRAKNLPDSAGQSSPGLPAASS